MEPYYLLYIAITLLTFCLMEAITWLTHKYVMHGFLWYLHRDHHQPKGKFFEKNDAFFFIFAVPSALFIISGLEPLNTRLFIGIGIALYGLAYFLVHDVLIHQRFKWFRNTKIPYLLALRRAHKMHHKHLEKTPGTCFGMLYVPKKYFTYYKKDK